MMRVVYRALLIVALVTLFTAPAAMANVFSSRFTFSESFIESDIHPCTGEFGEMEVNLRGRLNFVQVGESTFIATGHMSGSYSFEGEISGDVSQGRLTFSLGEVYDSSAGYIEVMGYYLSGNPSVGLVAYFAQDNTGDFSLSHVQIICGPGGGEGGNGLV